MVHLVSLSAADLAAHAMRRRLDGKPLRQCGYCEHFLPEFGERWCDKFGAAPTPSQRGEHCPEFQLRTTEPY